MNFGFAESPKMEFANSMVYIILTLKVWGLTSYDYNDGYSYKNKM